MKSKKTKMIGRAVLSPLVFVLAIVAMLAVAVLCCLGLVALPFAAMYIFVRDGWDGFTNIVESNPEE